MRLQNYWWLLIWPLLFGALSFVVNMQREELVDGRRCIRWTPLAAYALVIPFVIWAGWRQHFGDTETYRRTFQSLPTGFGEIVPYLSGVNKDRGFTLLELVFKTVISHSDVAFFVFIAAFQICCLVHVYRKYSPNYWLSIFFFIASTDYLSWMHNGMRQFLAAAIVFLCVPLIARRRYVLAVILVVLAAQIHLTALIFLPFIFVVNGRSWNFRTLIFIVGVIAAILFLDRVTGFIAEAMEDTAYEGDIEIFVNDTGTNIFRVLFYSVPALMAWIFRARLDRANNPVMNVCANLSIVAAGFYVFSFFTSGILIGRLPIYFSLANYILIPWLLREAFQRDSAVILESVFTLVYVAFFYYQCGLTWGLL